MQSTMHSSSVSTRTNLWRSLRSKKRTLKNLFMNCFQPLSKPRQLKVLERNVQSLKKRPQIARLNNAKDVNSSTFPVLIASKPDRSDRNETVLGRQQKPRSKPLSASPGNARVQFNGRLRTNPVSAIVAEDITKP
ncbi:hypothetical protein BKA81DRAFT_409810 [Phyllosticta paracitricarpa]